MTLSRAKCGFVDRDSLKTALYEEACVEHTRTCLLKVWTIGVCDGDAITAKRQFHDIRLVGFLGAYVYAAFGDKDGTLRRTATDALEAFEVAMLASDEDKHCKCADFCRLFLDYERHA